MPSTGSHARQLPPSSLPTRLVRRCLPTSATRALQAGVGPCPFRRRPLSGCRLSRKTFPAALSVHWPWSPSLPAPYSSARLGPSFDGFPVPRDHPTSLVPSPSRPFVLDGYHPLGGGREISLGKQRKTSCPCRRHYSRLPDGYWVRRRLPASPQDVRLPAFRSRSAWHFTIDFHQTPPRGPHPSDPTTAPLSHRCEVPSARALRGLSSSLHLLFCAHARRTKISCAGNPFPRGFEKSRIASGQPARGRERSTRLGTSWTWQPRLNPTQRQARVGGRIVWSDVYIPLRHCAHRGAARRKPCARTWAPRAMTRSEAQPVRKAVGKILSAARIRKIFSRWKKNLTAGAERWNGFPPQGLRWDICPNAARKNSFLPAESCSVARRNVEPVRT